MSSAGARPTVGPRSAPGANAWDSPEVDGRGSLDGADSGYKSRTSMSSERASMDEDTEGGSAPVSQIQEEQDLDPEGGASYDAEGGGNFDAEGGASYDPESGDYDDASDRTVDAPLLGVSGPKITATAATPLASPGRSNVEFGGEAEPGGGESYVPAPISRIASPGYGPPLRAAKAPSRAASLAAPLLDLISSAQFQPTVHVDVFGG